MKYFFLVAWAWIIILGGLIITPIGPLCIVCGPKVVLNPGDLVAGIVTIGIGVFGFLATVRNRQSGPLG